MSDWIGTNDSTGEKKPVEEERLRGWLRREGRAFDEWGASIAFHGWTFCRSTTRTALERVKARLVR